ncbi:MAG: hypothetical protein DI626_00020 [Micavibrio aeruginosavorus]|uniref:Uncharacterized protein n=1 Tax=Micavibrio aeruginosavorus TaxID=349221 RepID=A0A2W5A6R2_9BACT|nr:MAG: hypothetical protein DI626_00020 [Micavibrio aeruginosavorus]
MKTSDFNEKAGPARYGSLPSPVHPHGFQILLKDQNGRDVPVGEYIVLNTKEDPAISARKVSNLVSVLGGRDDAVPLGADVEARTLYQVVSEKDDKGFANIIFYELGFEGVSSENALLKIKSAGSDVRAYCEGFAEACSAFPLKRAVAPVQVSTTVPEGPSRQI